jgi:hypothetical protein
VSENHLHLMIAFTVKTWIVDAMTKYNNANMFPKPMKVKRGNTVRKITEELFDACLARDWGCVICGTTSDLDRPHHILYGNMAEYWPDKNNLDRLVTICRSDHHKIHFEWGNNYREDCINYLQYLDKNLWSL